MSSKSKSKKAVNQLPEEISSDEGVKLKMEELSSKKDTKSKKSTKAKKEIEIEETVVVSDSDKSFIESLGDPINTMKEEKVQTLVGIVSNKKNDITKMISAVNRKINQINTKINFEEYEMEEEEKEQILNNINELLSLQQILLKKYNAYICGKKLESEELTINNDKGKKQKKVKKVELDEEGNPVKKDTSKSHIYTKKVPYDAVYDFMEVPHDTLISVVDVQEKLRKFIKNEKDSGNENNVTGKLKSLLEAIISEKVKHDDSVSSEIPTKINNSGDIFKYSAYCFPKALAKKK